MLILRSTLLLAATLLFNAGCGPKESASRPAGAASESAPAESTAKGVVGLSVLTLTNPFFKEIGASMAQEGRTHGYTVQLVSGEFDVARQQDQVRDFIVRKVAAIVLTPCDSMAIGPAIKEANEAGIPVFTADIACQAPGVKVVTHVATDNYGGGREAGLAMVEALGPAGGKIGILSYNEIESCQLRVKGFKELITEHNASEREGQIQIVADLSGGAARDKGYKAAQDLLQAHGAVTGIFAINDPSALGARAAVEKAGKSNQVKIIGFDGQPEGKQAIREGRIYADPIQFPDKIGTETMRAIVSYFAGKQPPPQILIPTALYRKADAEKDPALK